MASQTDYWRSQAIKLITALRTEGKTYKQIGEILGISGQAIQMIHLRWIALKKLPQSEKNSDNLLSPNEKNTNNLLSSNKKNTTISLTPSKSISGLNLKKLAKK